MTDSAEPMQQAQGFSQVINNNPSTFALPNGSFSGSVNYLPGGTYNIWGQYSGDGTNAASTSQKTSITVNPENSGIYFNLFSPAAGSVQARSPVPASITAPRYFSAHRWLPAPSSPRWRTALPQAHLPGLWYSHRYGRLHRRRHNHQYRRSQCRGRRRVQRSLRDWSPLCYRQLRRRQQLQQIHSLGSHLHRPERYAADLLQRGEPGLQRRLHHRPGHRLQYRACEWRGKQQCH